MKRILFPLLLLFACGVFSSPIAAQEATPEVTPIVEETPAPVDPAPEQPATDESIWAGIARYGMAVLAGIGIGVTAAAGFLSRIKNDKATLDAIEWAGRGISPEALAEIRKWVLLLKDAGDVLDKVTDGKENVIAAPTRAEFERAQQP